jgi:hypothetical protein
MRGGDLLQNATARMAVDDCENFGPFVIDRVRGTARARPQVLTGGIRFWNEHP